MVASIAGALALIPGGGAAVAAAINAIGWLLRCGTCLKALAVLLAVAFTALHVHRQDMAACDDRIETDHRKAAAAAAQRDSDVARDLNRFFKPKLEALQQQNAALQKKVNDHAKRRAPAPAVKPSACRLGDAAGLLRPKTP